MTIQFERDFSLVVGVDRNYFRQFKTVFPLWLKFWSRLRSVPWLFFYDGASPELRDEINAVIAGHVHHSTTRLQAWHPPDAGQYEDQRDRMLTAWVLLPPALVTTRYWMKLDVDAFPVFPVPASFPNMRWFEGSPAVVGHSWHYTKRRGTKGDWFEILDAWGDASPLLAGTRPLGLRFPPGSNRVAHSRIASYISFFETDWSAAVANDCFCSLPDLTIPVPSQDTFFWYVATRMNRAVVRIKMKRHGFTNQSNFEKLSATVGNLLRGTE